MITHVFDNSNISQEIFEIDTWRAVLYFLGHGRKHMLAILPTIWRPGLDVLITFCLTLVTDFNKINKMIKKKTGSIFLIVYVIYGSLVYTHGKTTVSCFLPRLLSSYHTRNFQRSLKCKLVCIEGCLCLFHYVLDSQNRLVFVCFVQFDNQLDV